MYTVRLKPCAGGRPRTAGPYWATSAVSIWAFVSPWAISVRMKLRSASAWGDSATASGSWQVTHITSFSMSVSDARGVTAALAAGAGGSTSASEGSDA